MLSADDLLAGPRGRGLCLAVARRLGGGALEAVDVSPVHEWRSPPACVEEMDLSVSSAMYWQPPHDEDVEAADPAVVAALRRWPRRLRRPRRWRGGWSRST